MLGVGSVGVGWACEWWLNIKSVQKSSQEIFSSIFALPRRNPFFATLVVITTTPQHRFVAFAKQLNNFSLHQH